MLQYMKILFLIIFFIASEPSFTQAKSPNPISTVRVVGAKFVQEIELSNSKTKVSVSVSYNRLVTDSLKMAVQKFSANIKTPLATKIDKALSKVFFSVLEKNLIKKTQIYFISDCIQLLNYFLTHQFQQLHYANIHHLDIDLQYYLLSYAELITLSLDEKRTIATSYIQHNKQETVNVLLNYPDLPNQAVLIKTMIREYPDHFFKSIQGSPNVLKRLLKNSKTQEFKFLAYIFRMQDPKLVLPFFVELANKKITIEEIRKKQQALDKVPLYRLFVKMHVAHLEQIKQTRDTPLNFNMLYKALTNFADKNFITPMNARHGQNEKSRFRIIKDFNHFELYYLIVSGGDILYTSTFNFVYKQLALLLKYQNGMFLFENVHYDKYRKFIKTIASYNFLDSKSPYSFLNLINKKDKHDIVSRLLAPDFLDQENYLEDAADIISSFIGIRDKILLTKVNTEIEVILNDIKKQKKGKLVYSIFKQIIDNHFQFSAGDTVYANVANQLKQISTQELESPKDSVIYEQVFFYGDDDAVASYNYLLFTFSKRGWRIKTFPYWVMIESLRGNPIKIFVNKPQYLDVAASSSHQITLRNYFFKNHIAPTVVMHRGHSYFLSNTINQLPTSTKLFIMGSCGSNNAISDALRICGSAQIIATRQIATSVVNSKVFFDLNEDLCKTKNIEWETNWKKYGLQFKKTKYEDNFNEYILPQKNLASMFFKLFYQRMSELY